MCNHFGQYFDMVKLYRKCHICSSLRIYCQKNVDERVFVANVAAAAIITNTYHAKSERVDFSIYSIHLCSTFPFFSHKTSE